MGIIAKSSIDRIVKAVKTVESLGSAKFNQLGPFDPVSMPGWWGIVKATFDNQDSGDVYEIKGDVTAPTSDTGYFTVANPYMGKLITGMPVYCVPSSINDPTGDPVWFVAPFHLVYEVKLDAGITAVGEGAGSGTPGTCSIYEDGTDTTEDIDCYLRWVPNTTNGTAGALARASWDMRKQRFYIDAMEC